MIITSHYNIQHISFQNPQYYYLKEHSNHVQMFHISFISFPFVCICDEVKIYFVYTIFNQSLIIFADVLNAVTLSGVSLATTIPAPIILREPNFHQVSRHF